LGAELDFNLFGDRGKKLFTGDKPAEAAINAYRFCFEYQKAWDETKTFCKEVFNAGLLSSKMCSVETGSSGKLKLSGFSVVDENRIDALDNRTVNDWRKRHLLKYVYYHIASLSRIGIFSKLVNNLTDKIGLSGDSIFTEAI
jgi:hypothetical protein